MTGGHQQDRVGLVAVGLARWGRASGSFARETDGGATVSGRRSLSARGAARRAALLDAAVSVVAVDGSSGLTHRAVAAAAQVSLASVTYHFDSIEELRRATFERALEVLDDELAQLVQTRGGTMERMPGMFADYVVALLTQHREAAVTVNEMIVAASHDDRLRPTFHAYQEHLAGLLSPCVGGPEAGFMVAAALQGLVLSGLTHQDRRPADDDGVVRWRAAVVELINRVRHHPC